MKVIIQIPCYNEAEMLPETLSHLPRSLPGASCVEWLVIDDGSTDGTAEIAAAHGVHHVVRLSAHQGLARAFTAGLEACVHRGADIIVNTDADNQYRAEYIAHLIAPILKGQAQMVVGARPINDIRDFSPSKKMLQKLGSWTVRLASRTAIPDAASGFRAISRSAALQLNVFNEYTYTLETIIQSGRKNIPVTSVPIRTNAAARPSRLVKSAGSYVRRSMMTILRIFVLYQPMRVFLWIGSVPVVLGTLLVVRWLALFLLADPTRSRAPSLIAAAVLLLVGFQLWTFALIADLMSANRVLLEDVQLRLRRAEADPLQRQPMEHA